MSTAMMAITTSSSMRVKPLRLRTRTRVMTRPPLRKSDGTPLQALADQVRAVVYAAVGELVGLEVIEVNIEINDVYVPGPAKPAPSAEARPVREAIQ